MVIVLLTVSKKQLLLLPPQTQNEQLPTQESKMKNGASRKRKNAKDPMAITPPKDSTATVLVPATVKVRRQDLQKVFQEAKRRAKRVRPPKYDMTIHAYVKSLNNTRKSTHTTRERDTHLYYSAISRLVTRIGSEGRGREVVIRRVQAATGHLSERFSRYGQ